MTRNRRTLQRVTGSLLTMLLCGAPQADAAPQNRIGSPPQTPRPLNIAGKEFRIGMPREQAMALLAECCNISAQSEQGTFILSKTAPYMLLGGISFRNGRVSTIEKDEKQSQNKEAADFVLAFYRLLLDGRTTSQSAVTMSVFPDEISNAADRHIVLAFPDGRKIRIKHGALDTGDVVVDLTEER